MLSEGYGIQEGGVPQLEHGLLLEVCGGQREMPREPLILIIDDDELDLAAMQMALGSRGYQVVTSNNGEEGLARARELQPDLVIVDLLMPPPDGFEVCRRLDEDEGLREIPRIVVTALREKMHKAAASVDVQSRLDADAYMDKPLDPEALERQVREVLESGRAGRSDR